MAPKVVDKEAKKADILKAAMQVFAQKGVVKAKMSDVAEAAGIGKGTIYEYFRSKEDIFADAYHFMFSRTEQAILNALSQTDDPIKKLELLIDVSIHSFIEDNQDFAEIMMDFWAEGIRHKDSNILKIVNINDVYVAYRQVIRSILDEGQNDGVFKDFDTYAMAAVFIGAFDGVTLQWIMDKEAVNLRKVAKTMLESFLNGIKK